MYSKYLRKTFDQNAELSVQRLCHGWKVVILPSSGHVWSTSSLASVRFTSTVLGQDRLSGDGLAKHTWRFGHSREEQRAELWVQMELLVTVIIQKQLCGCLCCNRLHKNLQTPFDGRVIVPRFLPSFVGERLQILDSVLSPHLSSFVWPLLVQELLNWWEVHSV